MTHSIVVGDLTFFILLTVLFPVNLIIKLKWVFPEEMKEFYHNAFSEVKIPNFMILGELLPKNEKESFTTSIEVNYKNIFKKLKLISISVYTNAYLGFIVFYSSLNGIVPQLIGYTLLSLSVISLIYLLSLGRINYMFELEWHQLLLKSHPDLRIGIKDKIYRKSHQI